MNPELTKAIALRQVGKYQDAEKIMTDLYLVNPDDALINYHFAWLCDVQGKESSAVPYYETAIKNGLSDDNLRGALLGLGSTYRTLGMYHESVSTLQKGLEYFPDAKEFPIFLAMALYNIGEHKNAVSTLLNVIVDDTVNEDILRFKAPIVLYAEDLDKTWLDD